MPKSRDKMRLRLSEQHSSGSWVARTLKATDAAALATLVYEANLGGIDYEGETRAETLAEVQATLDGKYGPLLRDCSFVVEQDGRLVSGSIVTLWRGEPLVAFLMTHPDVVGQGLGTFVLENSINALLRAGYEELFLYVTVGNEAAQHIYSKLGFEVVVHINGGIS